MKKYIETKIIEAKPMTRGEYNEYRGYRGWEPRNPADEGYLVKYSDSYESWIPKNVFDEAYRVCDNMTFGLAIEAMKKGKKVARKGWNGKGMFLYYVPVGAYKPYTEIAASLVNEDGLVEYGAYIAMKTVQGNVVPWLASQTDMLAEDWVISDDSNINTGKEVYYFKRDDKVFDTLYLGLYTNKETGKIVCVKSIKNDCNDVVYELYDISYDEEPSGDRYCYVSSLIETISQPEFFKNYKSIDLKDMVLEENNMEDKKEVYININTAKKIYVDKITTNGWGKHVYTLYNKYSNMRYHISESQFRREYIKYDDSFKKYTDKISGKVVEAKRMNIKDLPNNSGIINLDEDGYCIIYWEKSIGWMGKDKFERKFTLIEGNMEDKKFEVYINIYTGEKRYVDRNTTDCRGEYSVYDNDSKLIYHISEIVLKKDFIKYDNSFKKYITDTKVVEAKPMKARYYPNNATIKDLDKDGYCIIYWNDYVVWMEKNKFEEIYTLEENNMEDNKEVYINCTTGMKRYVDKSTTDCRGEYPVYDNDNKLIYHVSESDLENEYIKYDDSFKKYINKFGTVVEAKSMKAKDFPFPSPIKNSDKDGYCIIFKNGVEWLAKDKFEKEYELIIKVSEKEECSCGKSCTCNKEETEDQQLHQSILDEIHKLYISKNKDYGNSFSKLFKEFDLLGTDYMLTTKMNRFKQLSKGQVPNNESIRDTLMDLANYAILTIMELDSKED